MTLEYKKIRLPDGTIGKVPANMTDEEIMKAVASYQPKEMNQPESLKEKVLNSRSLSDELTRGPRNLGAAAHKLLHKTYNLPSAAASMMGQPEVAQMLNVKQPEEYYQKAWGLSEKPEWHDILAQSVPEMAGAALVPEVEFGKLSQLIGKIPKAGKYLNKILGESLPQAGYASIMSEPGHEANSAITAGATQAPFSALSQFSVSPKPHIQRVVNAGLGIGLGLGTDWLLNQTGMNPYYSGIGGGMAGLLGAKAAGTKAMMMDELTHGIDMQKAIPRLEAARRLELPFLTPAEAARSPHLAEKQGEYGRTQEGSVLSYEKNKQRNAAEARVIEKTLDEIYHPEKMEGLKNEGYEQLKEMELPEDYAKQFSDNHIILRAERKLSTDPVYKQGAKKLPSHEEIVIDELTGEPKIDAKTGEPETKKVLNRDNVAYWNEVKKIIDDDLEKLSGKNPTKEYYLDQARRELIQSLDDIHPEYGDVRNLSEREHVRRDLEKAFDRTQVHTGASFYNALKSEKKFNEMMHHLRNVPKAQQALKDMRELFQDFSNPPTPKAALGASRMGMRQQRNAVDKLKHIAENMFTRGKFDKEAIEFMTSPGWHNQMEEINKISDKQKRMAKTIEFFGKIAAQSNAKQEPFLTTQNYDIYE